MIYKYQFVCDHGSHAGEPFDYDGGKREQPFEDLKRVELEKHRAAHGEHAEHAILQCVGVRSS